MGTPPVGNSPDTQRWSAMPARSRWRAHGTTAARALLAGLVAIVLAVVLAEPAFADPSDQPGGTSGVLDSQALDKLQTRAAQVQGDLQARQAEVVAAREALSQAQAAVVEAPKALDDAQRGPRRLPGRRRLVCLGGLPGRRTAEPAHPAAQGRQPWGRALRDGLPRRSRPARR